VSSYREKYILARDSAFHDSLSCFKENTAESIFPSFFIEIAVDNKSLSIVEYLINYYSDDKNKMEYIITEILNNIISDNNINLWKKHLYLINFNGFHLDHWIQRYPKYYRVREKQIFLELLKFIIVFNNNTEEVMGMIRELNESE